MSDSFFPPKNAQTLAVPEAGTEYANIETMNWVTTGVPGFLSKPLIVADNGQTTSLMKIEPGARSEPHSHQTVEQIYVLEGSFFDQDNVYRAGDFILRAPGTVHMAGSDIGAVVLVSTYSICLPDFPR